MLIRYLCCIVIVVYFVLSIQVFVIMLISYRYFVLYCHCSVLCIVLLCNFVFLSYWSITGSSHKLGFWTGELQFYNCICVSCIMNRVLFELVMLGYLSIIMYNMQACDKKNSVYTAKIKQQWIQGWYTYNYGICYKT